MTDRIHPLTGRYRILASGRSAHQSWEVWETERCGRLYRLDGSFMASEADAHIGHEALVHVPAIAHGAVRHALVLGGGDGGSARELLRHARLVRATVVEIDAQVIALAKQYLPRIHDNAFDDVRVETIVGDAHAYVINSAPASFDLIVFDLTEPHASAVLHTDAFFAQCKRALREGGALSVQLGSPITEAPQVTALSARLARHFRHVTLFQPEIPLYGGPWTMACASDMVDPARLDADTLAARIHALVGVKSLTPSRYHQWLALA